MKKTRLILCLLVTLTGFLGANNPLRAQGTAFTFQGRLNDGANPANGSYDFMYQLYDVISNQVSITLTNVAVPVSNGLFATTLDFGYAFAGDPRWLNLWVRTNGSGDFAALVPGQKITAAPYAMTAEKLTGLISDSQITGPILRTTFNGAYTGQLIFTPAGVAPFAVGSTNQVTDLNADLLDGRDASAFWQLGGNAGTTAGTHFLGTTDNQPLEIKVNGARGLRIEPTTFGVNFIAGNENNSIAPNALISTIGGGALNIIEASAIGSTIAGGDINTIQTGAGESVISGGVQNLIGSNSIRAVIAGGLFNRIGTNAGSATISGGRNNRITNDSFNATISGGRNNVIETASEAATIAGGSNNVIGASSPSATISGGWDNTIGPASPYGGTIGGGLGNRIDDANFQAVIGGGYQNRIHTYGAASVIGGGEQNNVYTNAIYAVIGGGQYNTVSNSATYGTVGGGYNNAAGGLAATVPGGYYNRAGGAYSFAAGYEARALHEGSFVWSEPPTNLFQFDVGAESTANYQFVIRASGGVQLVSDTSIYCSAMLRQSLNLWGTSYGIGVQSSSLYFRCNNGGANDGFIWYKGGQHADGYADSGGGTELAHLGSFGLYVNGAFIGASDRNLKENFKPVDPRAVLDKVAALPLSEWNYKADTTSRHVGPMAQDFYAAFGVGPDDKHIATVDADGVALAAIQGLNRKLTDELQRRDAENAELKTRLEKLERLMNQGLGGAK